MAAAGDEPEVARPGAGDQAGVAAGRELGEDALGGEPVVGERRAEPCAQLVDADARADGAVGDAGEVGRGETVGELEDRHRDSLARPGRLERVSVWTCWPVGRAARLVAIGKAYSPGP
jgi:hypothetical protein